MTHRTHLITNLRSQWFSLTMVLLGVAAWAWPELGVALNPAELTKSFVIATVFFLSGLVLRTEEVRRGFGQLRLHAYVQLFSFVLIPLATWAALLPWRNELPEGLVIGFYLLAVLPTTITSCVVFTQLAGGNTPAALFNAIAGNLAGILISPALLLLMIGTGGPRVPVDAGSVLLQLLLLVAFPFAVGQALHWAIKERTLQWRRRLSPVSSASILIVIYFVFCKSFAEGTLNRTIADMILPLSMLLPAHLLVLGLAGWGGKLLGFSREDLVAIMFCAPQKTLALGMPLIAASLATRPDLLGLASLPIIVYHPFQLFIAGLLKEPLRRYAHGRLGPP